VFINLTNSSDLLFLEEKPIVLENCFARHRYWKEVMNIGVFFSAEPAMDGRLGQILRAAVCPSAHLCIVTIPSGVDPARRPKKIKFCLCVLSGTPIINSPPHRDGNISSSKVVLPWFSLQSVLFCGRGVFFLSCCHFWLQGKSEILVVPSWYFQSKGLYNI